MTQQIIVFGEVLFDRFPDGKVVLGGAPFNVAWNLQAFGVNPLFVSRVGQDALGAKVKEAMTTWGMNLAGLQTDPTHPTGVVDVTFVENEPHYDIVNPCAYDFIEAAALPPMPAGSLLYHGTLALRHPTSAATLQQLKQVPATTVFMDVNLRSPWWEIAPTQRLMMGGKWVKLNEGELAQLVTNGQTIQDRIDYLLTTTPLEVVIVTQGEQGATIATKTGERFQVTPPPVTAVADTVGAGDSFSSVILLGWLRGWPLATSLQRAQDFASAIVGIQGATNLDKSFYEFFVNSWD